MADAKKILFSNLGEEIKEMEVAAGETLGSFLKGLGHEENKETLDNLRINGLAVSGFTAELVEGDFVTIVPKVAGGA